MNAPRQILIANPGTKRCEAYRRAWVGYWNGRGPELVVVPWAEIAACRGDLESHPAFERPSVVRLESPGKNPGVYRQFLAVADPAGDWPTCEFPKGLLLKPGLWYRGFELILQGLQHSFDERPHLKPTASPLAVATMFDKLATTKLLRGAGIPVPDWLEDPNESYSRYWPSTYLKLRYGSSASGIIALRCGASSDGSTTLAEINGQYFNSRLVRNIRGIEMFSAIDFLQKEGAFAQQGIPMAHIEGQNFDLRVVCLYGKPVATIFRLSRHPMTNLHLGGTRGNFARCRAAIPNRYWLDAMEQCEAAAAQFDSAVAGVDLVFERGFRNSFVLEVNAFGDFFPWWTDTRGRNLHWLEIDAIASRTA